MNETQAQIIEFIKSEPGAFIKDVMKSCYLSSFAAYSNLEWLNNLGVLGKSYRGNKVWYTFVRDL